MVEGRVGERDRWGGREKKKRDAGRCWTGDQTRLELAPISRLGGNHQPSIPSSVSLNFNNNRAHRDSHDFHPRLSIIKPAKCARAAAKISILDHPSLERVQPDGSGRNERGIIERVTIILPFNYSEQLVG